MLREDTCVGTEADICRTYVVPQLYTSGWSDEQIREQVTFTAGRIIVAHQVKRAKPKRADYLLAYRPNYPIAVVEAKSAFHRPADGMQQAKDYAQILGLSFAYATNGQGIVEFDFTTGIEQEIAQFPSPKDLWNRLRISKGLDEALEDKLLAPYHYAADKLPRYYQQIAINRAVEAIVSGQDRVLLTLATGTGKTFIAFQIAWKLWNSNWNRKGLTGKKPRILFLADRSVLVDDPKDKTFAPFGDARHKIEHGKALKSREMYFATYQALVRDDKQPALYHEYAPDFFDLIIVDEAHRGSARDDSLWRDILTYFTGATQLGMTATPLRQESRDTYTYFGNPIYTYSLKQGIMDGFLAPYQVRRVITDIDALGYRPFVGETDLYGRDIPDREYTTVDYERKISLMQRTEAIAHHLTQYLTATDRYAKTIVFCVDQEHADQMRQALNNANADLVCQHADYVARVTADDGDVGKVLLSTFQDVESKTPVILTTSKLLTTGVDAPMVKNIVLCSIINSMAEFKQIIGRGTRVREDYGKLFFTILDYTGTATRNFADPDFDGDPVLITQETIDDQGEVTATAQEEPLPDLAGIAEGAEPYSMTGPQILTKDVLRERKKLYVRPDGLRVEVRFETVYELDAAGKQLRVVALTTYTGEQVVSLYPTLEDLRGVWKAADSRASIVETLEERGIDLAHVAAVMDQPDADPFDLLCHLAFHAPLRTRRERADRLQRERSDFFARFTPAAREILDNIIEQYAEYGPGDLAPAIVLTLPRVTQHRTKQELAAMFGGPLPLAAAITELQALLYAA